MGFISDIFGNNLNEKKDIKNIPTRMPSGAIEELKAGILPIMNTSKLLLKKNEVCHYVESGILVTEKIVKHTEGATKGFSFRVCKGVTYRIGSFKGIPVEKVSEELTKGILYITNKRIVFVANKNSFDKKHSYLTSTEANDCELKLQYGNKVFKMFLPDGVLANNVIYLINK